MYNSVTVERESIVICPKCGGYIYLKNIRLETFGTKYKLECSKCENKFEFFSPYIDFVNSSFNIKITVNKSLQ